MTKFVHLRTQSAYSMLESALRISSLVDLAATYDMPAVALTDRNNLFASLEFSVAAKSAGIQPINGALLDLQYTDHNNRAEFGEIALLAKNKVGYGNLLKLVSGIYDTEATTKLHITTQDLNTHHEGLILLSGYTKGPIGKILLSNNKSRAEYITEELLEIFGDRFYFELMRHNLSQEIAIEQDYIQLATRYNIPIVATNNVLFEKIEMFDVHDILLCIAQNAKKEQVDRAMSHNQYFFKSSAQMSALFCDIPEAVANTYYVSQRCSYAAESHAPMLPSFGTADISEKDMLRNDAIMGLKLRLQKKFIKTTLTEEEEASISEQYHTRIMYELDVICNMNFCGYFLIVADFIQWSKRNNIMVGPGRGSGAGSVVAWSLLITDIDPLEYGLLFERFLNPERVSMPDFDIDFCQERRSEVIDYVRHKYGDARVAHIITFGSLQPKAAIKDVARVLNLPFKFANYISELIPFNAVNPVTLQQAIDDVPELRMAANGQGLYNAEFQENNVFDDDQESSINALIKHVLSIALNIEGLPRHSSIHAAGMIIAGVNIVDYAPLYRDRNSSMNIIQYSMQYAEKAGFIKFDFLGLQTLTAMSGCMTLLSKRGIQIDIESVFLEDKATFAMMSRGDSIGIFQFDGGGMRDALRRLRPDRLNDLIALTSLYRPGPMENLQAYIDCKLGRVKPEYLHPLVEDLLKETYGIMIYQEQVIEVAKILAGFSLGAADLLRKAMGKKIKSEMDAQEASFVLGCEQNDIDEHEARDIFAKIAKFAGYGFNKSHAASYAMISYQMAYLKAHYLVEFLVANMNLEAHDHERLSLFVNEATVNNIAVLPPCINLANADFMILYHGNKGVGNSAVSHNDKIVFGFCAIKGMVRKVAESIVLERRSGDFININNFIQRMAPHKAINKRILEALIKAGSFDNLYKNRNELFTNVGLLLSHGVDHVENLMTQQLSLLSVSTAQGQSEMLHLVPYADWSLLEKYMYEFHAIGVFLTNHPINLYGKHLQRLSVKSSRDLNTLPNGRQPIKIAGIIEKKHTRMSNKNRFTTLKMSDSYGLFEVTIFSDDVQRVYSELIQENQLVIIDCDCIKTYSGIKLVALHIINISELDNVVNEIDLKIHDLQALQDTIDFLSTKICDTNGNANITLSIDINSKFYCKIKLKENFKFTIEELRELQQS